MNFAIVHSTVAQPELGTLWRGSSLAFNTLHNLCKNNHVHLLNIDLSLDNLAKSCSFTWCVNEGTMLLLYPLTLNILRYSAILDICLRHAPRNINTRNYSCAGVRDASNCFHLYQLISLLCDNP